MDFKALKLKIASPEEILKWSYGEVVKPETINYRTQRPEKDGLFSERIFGPTKDYECYCGKYKKIRYKGIICDKCGVEVTRSSVRRERMGHIKLAAPIAHIWFLRSAPSRIGLALDTPLARLEKVVYYAAYIVTEVNEEEKQKALEELEKEFKLRKKEEKGRTEELKEAAESARQSLKSLRPRGVISEMDFYNLSRKFGGVFKAMSGAEGIRRVLEQMDLEKEIRILEKELDKTDDFTRRQKLARRLRFFAGMRKNKIRPEWMVFTVLPVLPPDLRPMVALDGGRYATSDLNDLYRRVINRNNRLKKLLELNAPEIIVTNEKRMLQEAVDALIDNTARTGRTQMSSRRRPLRSLADMLKGKRGRFRQNLLGKRVDYSGRSVIVVGPNLKYDECGLPKKMALELFRPFVISKILERGMAHNIKNANRLIEAAPAEVWEILEEVIKNKKVLLNRAPTLHRLGIQAFRPVLIEDLCIQIPPLVCSGFNADFDGDQMAVHLPLTEEAQEESAILMLSGKNLLKPASGDPIMGPWNDIVLGIYFLTEAEPDAKGTGKIFSDKEEALLALDFGEVDLGAVVKIAKELETTCGRLIFNEVLPAGFDFVNEMVSKKVLTRLLAELISRYGFEEAKLITDRVQKLGFEYATQSGITWGIQNLVVPKEKAGIVKEARVKLDVIEGQYEDGLLTVGEKKSRSVEIWNHVKEEVEEMVKKELTSENPVYKIVNSGARGSWEQANQMMGMRGLVRSPKGEIIDMPVISSYKEGLSPLEYFISVHGNRKGLVDTALKTAEAGYLTRRLIDVAQDLIIREKDCRTKEGIEIFKEEGLEYGHKWSDRIFSRTSLEDAKEGSKILVRAGEIITHEKAKSIENSKLHSIKVRSPLACKTLYGVCSVCYGLDLGRNEEIKEGEAVGIIAAQSIGEPGTQLTLRTTHSGGVAKASDITYGLPRIEEIFEARSPKGRAVLCGVDGVIGGIEDKGNARTISVNVSKKGKKGKVIEYTVPRSTPILADLGKVVSKGDILTEGSIDLYELFKLRGKEAVFRYIAFEVQRIYVTEGARINNKHIEIIARQMFGRVRVTSSGDSNLAIGRIIDKSKFFEVNRGLKKAGKEPARAEELLLGITKASLTAEGFLAPASFQETARVLVASASEGRMDMLRGLKENVIIGRLLPIGTSFRREFAAPEDEEEIGKDEEAELTEK